MTYMPHAKAENVACINRDNDTDGWNYVVEYRGDYAVIKVFDDENVFLGYI